MGYGGTCSFLNVYEIEFLKTAQLSLDIPRYTKYPLEIRAAI